jgi:hypothetical protein
LEDLLHEVGEGVRVEELDDALAGEEQVLFGDDGVVVALTLDEEESVNHLLYVTPEDRLFVDEGVLRLPVLEGEVVELGVLAVFRDEQERGDVGVVLTDLPDGLPDVGVVVVNARIEDLDQGGGDGGSLEPDDGKGAEEVVVTDLEVGELVATELILEVSALGVAHGL